MTYDHKNIERDAQALWAKENLNEVDLEDATKEPYYLLTEFPYPSGDLHIGHWYAFALTDIYARFLRLQGKNVLFPIGFDAFGLPAENAAIKHGLDPKEWTYKNIERMSNQLRSMGASFDWTKKIVTADPEYYRWTQWLFAKLFEHKLAERREAVVKWCPKDQTVLANEQVVNGLCERCGTEVEEEMLTQWFLKITEYADRLLNGLDALPWREEIKEAQRAWIGKSEGAKISFPIASDSTAMPANQSLTVFTTRPDTIYGVTYIVVAPDHSWVKKCIADFPDAVTNSEEVTKYIASVKKKTERERSENRDKTGVRLSGVTAIHPLTKEKLSVYIADYVLASYGTGAVMAVPAHDERDYAFAQKFNLPIKRILASDSLPYVGDGMLVESGEFTGRNNREAVASIIKATGGEVATNYRLRDWLVSRQRYWGCPIPIVYDPEGNPHTIGAEHLPWLLPTDVDFTPTGASPLSSSKELKDRVTRIFGEGWTPEFDTLDTFVDSSWYFLRFLNSHSETDFSNASLLSSWMPVKRYSGGSEHTTMHVLYARFFTMALYDLALVPVQEPFYERMNRGLIMGTDGQKMSKSKGNVVNPDEFVERYGADTVRLYLAFIGPYNEPGQYPWNLDGVASMRKFIERIIRVVEKSTNSVKDDQDLWNAFAQTTIKCATDIERFKFNTAISSLMILLNHCEKQPSIHKVLARQFCVLLSPFAPHTAEYLWSTLAGEGSVHRQNWPIAIPPIATDASLGVSINGRVRGTVTISLSATEEEALNEAKKIPRVQELLDASSPKRIIYVPGRILNIVL